MRIALYNLTTTTKLGGVETCFWALAREMARRGIQVEVVGGQGEIGAAENTPNLKVVTFPFKDRSRFPDLGSRFRKFAERRSLARRAGPHLAAGGFDAIIMGKPYDIPAALKARKKSGAKLCYFSGGGEFMPGYAWLTRKLDYFCACSRYDADDIYAHKKVRPAVNHYGVDTERFRLLGPDAEFAAAWGVDPAAPVLASGVRLVPFKGIDVALRAVALIQPRLAGLRYLIAGSGPAQEKLQTLCRELGLEDTVRFVGSLPHEDLARFYSLARLAVFPSLEKEALGIAVGEAMACGKATVVTEVGGMPELTGDEAGVRVPPRDPQALAEAVLGLFNQPEAIDTLGRAARDRIVERFTWSACVDRLLAGLGLAAK